MKLIYVITEGQSETNFVKKVLNEYFWSLNETKLIPITVMTKNDKKRGRMYKGGMSTFEKARTTIKKTLEGLKNKETFVTTMFDFYKLPTDTPGLKEAKKINDPYGKIKCIEEKISACEKIYKKVYFPYIQLHEFEALLFSDLDAVQKFYFETDINSLRECVETGGNPELINNGEKTSPSKRILSCISNYDKVTDSVSILKEIGVDKLKESCKHFSEWIDGLEGL